MSAAKTLFLRDPNLVKAALAITKGDDFAKILVFARAEFSSNNPTYEQIVGANRFINTLMNLPDSEDVKWEEVSSGIDHDLEVKRKTFDPEQPKPEK